MTRLRWSDLRWMGKSPAHFRYYRENPIQMTPAMRLGALVHGIALKDCFEPCVYEGERRGKAWAEFRDGHEGVEIFTRAEFEFAGEIADAVMAGSGGDYLDHGRREHRIEWEHAGVPCHGTPDVYTADRIVDLKITADASPQRFPWQARKMGWLAQLCWYQNGLAHADWIIREELYLVAVEPKPPFASTVWQLTASAVEHGTRQWVSYFETFKQCSESGEWPGYPAAVQPLYMPEDEDLVLTSGGEEFEL